MFSKSKEQSEATPIPQQAAKTPRTTRPGVPSIISADLTVEGTLVSSGDVQVDGKVQGDVRAGALVVGEKASIDGDIYAEEAIIRGRVEGGIRARKVQLCATCHVEGNILHEALSVEAGAFFEGNCRHSDNPLAEGWDGAVQRRPVTSPSIGRPAPSHTPQALATPIRPAPPGDDEGRTILPPRAAAEFKPLKP